MKQKLRQEIDLEANSNHRTFKVYKALKVSKAQRMTSKATKNEAELSNLKQIVNNEKTRVDQRLEIVREKQKMLTQLINHEELALPVDSSKLNKRLYK